MFETIALARFFIAGSGSSKRRKDRQQGIPNGEELGHGLRFGQSRWSKKLRCARFARCRGRRKLDRRIQSRLRQDAGNGLCAHRRSRRRNRREPTPASAHEEGRNPNGRRHLFRQRRQSRAIRDGLQSKRTSYYFFPRRDRVHGGPRR